MEIQLGQLKGVIPNAVYSMPSSNRGINDTFLLGRFQEPSVEQVAGLISTRAKALFGQSILVVPQGDRYISGATAKSELDLAFLRLPSNVRESIKNGAGDYWELVLGNIAEGDGSTYVSVKHGLLPEQVIQKHQPAIDEQGLEWYRQAFLDPNLRQERLGERWRATLAYRDGFPPREEIDCLLAHQTYGSRSLNIRPTIYNANEVRGVLTVVLDSLSSPEAVNSLTDTSDVILEGKALKPLLALGEALEQQVAVAATS